jgi:hypothetical protein
VEAAGDVDVLLLDKTGTITLGNRQAMEFIPVSGVSERELAEVAQLASLADETPEGRSIVVLAKEKYGLRGSTASEKPGGMHFIPFSAQTRMSGVDMDGLSIRKGAADAITTYIQNQGNSIPVEMKTIVDDIARHGGTPLVVARNGEALGVGELLARLRAALRRTAQTTNEPVFSSGSLKVDLARRLVTVSGREVQLTPTEYELLRVLVTHAGKVLTHHYLLREVWGAEYGEEFHMLHVNISNLRRKIEPDAARPFTVNTPYLSSSSYSCTIWTIVQWETGTSQRIDSLQNHLKSVLCGVDWTAGRDSRKVNSPGGGRVSANQFAQPSPQ